MHMVEELTFVELPDPSPSSVGSMRYLIDRGPDGVVASTTASGLLRWMIGEGYDPTGVDGGLIDRHVHACVVAASIQSTLVVRATLDGKFDPSSSAEAVLTALFDDREHPVASGCVWSEAFPTLMVVATSYVGVGKVPKGNVKVLDPRDELGYLLSLHSVGGINLWTSDGLGKSDSGTNQ